MGLGELTYYIILKNLFSSLHDSSKTARGTISKNKLFYLFNSQKPEVTAACKYCQLHLSKSNSAVNITWWVSRGATGAFYCPSPD